MKRKRVLFFIESFSGGGAERVLLTILRNLDMTRFKASVLVMSDNGVYRNDFHSLGIDIHSVLGHNPGFLDRVRYKLLYNILPAEIALKFLLRGITADTYVAFVEGYCTRIFSRLPDSKRKIAWVHIDLKNFPWPISKGIYKDASEEMRAYQTFDLAVGVSNDVSEVLRSGYNINQVRTIYNPIDENRIKSMAGEECAITVDKSVFNIVSVGRLTAQKGYDRLIDMMPEILSFNPDVRLYIVGEGEERSTLEHMIKERNIESSVILTGFISNPYSLMRNMDLFVCSSVAEGFSLVIAEAMTVGLPVVSMKCAGPNELLDYGRYGMLCGTYEELSETLKRLSRNQELVCELKLCSKTRGAFFNTRKILSEVESIL